MDTPTLALVADLDVAVVEAGDDEVRATLRAQHHPCLILVPDDVGMPSWLSLFEDWIRMSASDADVLARAVNLRHRASDQRPAWQIDDGVLRFGTQSVILSPHETLLIEALLRSEGRVVDRAALTEAVWPEGTAENERALDSLVKSARQRLVGTPLTVHTVRGRGHYISGAEVVDRGPEFQG